MYEMEINILRRFMKQGSVLELGVGTGRCSLVLAKAGHNVVGIDITRKMLEVAKIKMKQVGVEFEVVNMDAEMLGFRESFDNVICFHTFHFLSRPLVTLKNCYHVLRPGGRCIVSFENRNFWNITFNRYDVIPKNLYTPREVEQLFRIAGFIVIGRRKIFHAPYRFYRKAPKFLLKPIIKVDQKKEGWLIAIVAGEKRRSL